MRRVLVLLASTTLLLAGGCGGKSYETRLDRTLDLKRYIRRLDENVLAAAKGKLEPNLIYVRPPMNMEGPMKEFAMTVLEPGRFDVAESYVDAEKKSSLHVLARLPKPKTPAGKKAPAPEPARGDFVDDVAAELAKTYSIEVDKTKAKEETKKSLLNINKFKHLTLSTGGKTIQVYFQAVKQSYEVALIFEYPSEEIKSLNSKIDLTLESFATGEMARRAFTGKDVEEETGEGGAAPGVAF